MTRLPLRRLIMGPAPAPERIFFLSLWFRGHNNPRYAELLPRLVRLDPYLLTLAEGRIVRGLQYRALRATRRAWNAAAFSAANRRYRFLFTADVEQIPRFRGPVVADLDDPTYASRELRLLRSPNLAAYVVTAERAGRRFRELGIDKPYHVIPQGVSLSSVDVARVREIGHGLRRNGEAVVGYMAGFLLTGRDRDGGNPLYNVDHLLDLWDEIHDRAANARLWLIGGASDRVRARCAGRDDILVLGRLPRAEALEHVANLDIALYPRTEDQGVQAAKVAEYMGLGVPTVSYDYEVTEDLRQTGAGILVGSPREFVDAVERLVREDETRRRVAEAARTAGAERDWDVLARRYESDVLDRYLTPEQPR